MSQIVVMISLFMGRKVLFERSVYVCVMKELDFDILLKMCAVLCKNITLQKPYGNFCTNAKYKIKSQRLTVIIDVHV
jgi:hypothetical protein